jgi:S-formylglutathione hydrolase
MNFTIFFPAGAGDTSSQSKAPILYYLSGLTCTDENVIQKAGAQKACAKHGIAFVAPDTSPRCESCMTECMAHAVDCS